MAFDLAPGFIVKNKETEKLIDWGDVNLPLSEESFEVLENAVKKEMEQKDLFVFDGYAGADERYRLSVSYIRESYMKVILSVSRNYQNSKCMEVIIPLIFFIHL